MNSIGKSISKSGLTGKGWRGAMLVSIVGLMSCGSNDSEPPPSGPDAWAAVFQDQPGALLRAWGTSTSDVYLVGSDVGSGPAVLRYDGVSWRKLHPPTRGTLWWVVGVGPDDVRMVGDGGVALSYSPSKDEFTVRPTNTDLTLFGVWGASPTDVWYVGGDTGRGRGVILRDDGSSVTELSHAATASAAFFKAQGTSANDVWLVGQLGHALHYDGTQLADTDTGTDLPLMGIHGRAPDRFFAAGGVADGVLLSWDGSAWHSETPPETPQMISVWASSDEKIYAAGFNGRVFGRTDGRWSELAAKIPTYQDIHAIWTDEKGGIWLVGGRLAENPPKAGMLVHYGQPISSELRE
ncbi:MAG: hypothetical protein HY791_30665 [Deltaproteobacteria bacterium]|nr:hypothetical protein [Deltaproteobacteria bacterium]